MSYSCHSFQVSVCRSQTKLYSCCQWLCEALYTAAWHGDHYINHIFLIMFIITAINLAFTHKKKKKKNSSESWNRDELCEYCCLSFRRNVYGSWKPDCVLSGPSCLTDSTEREVLDVSAKDYSWVLVYSSRASEMCIISPWHLSLSASTHHPPLFSCSLDCLGRGHKQVNLNTLD